MIDLLSPIQFVIDHAQHVKVNKKNVAAYVAAFMPATVDHWMSACPFEWHSLPNVDDEVDRWFLADSMAFCFWGYPTKWTIEYQGKKIDGWWALLASFQRTLEAGTPLLEGQYLAQMTDDQARELFAGDPEIPLFAERLKIFHDIGTTLVTKYNGRFHNFLKEAPHDATDLLTRLVSEFPTFDDTSIYQDQRIFFYKKAQLFIHDLVIGFPDTPYAKITGLADFTGEADYKIPAILRKLSILEYDQELSDLVDSRTELVADSVYEVEIRAGMLAACHLICEGLKQRGIKVLPIELDGILWVASQTKSPDDKPYHLTLTTDY